MTTSHNARRNFLKFLAASPLCNAMPGLGFAHAVNEDGHRIASPDEAIDIFDLKATAKQILPPAHYGYMATGTNSDKTLHANREAFDNFYLRSRHLVNVREVDMSVELLGRKWSSPIIIAPCGGQRAFHSDGELAVARAAKELDHLQILSTVSSTSIEQVAEARDDPLWFQLYTNGGWPGVRKMLRRAEAAGCPAVVLTVDIPLTPSPSRHTLYRAERVDTRDCAICHEGSGMAARRKPMLQGVAESQPYIRNPALTWEFLDRLQQETQMKVFVKGIVTAEDAERCVEQGVDGIIVSNHGGRADDSGRGTVDSLAEVAPVAKGKTTLLMDSGVRRGTDILKALALGADAILIGRPYLWGLASFGQDGVERALQILRYELKIAMEFAGTPKISDIEAGAIGKI